ncbi:hypothetical protein [Williamsia sp. CHRR-6]|uniref:hypothetical protein n=1 Tax=Williamsia sp. CHRR-6 TaxID=2835871 RepID=UPI001BD943D5|nr:hypothetical protein [Williamsia sp. CHRR-6]MBT0566088.1 hypothetical protein [Williamsia sp. CHRR-6]
MMAGLCVADIDRWDVGEINRVFGICTNVADHCDATSTTLANLDAFKSWGGDAAEAAKDSVHKTRLDLDRHGDADKKVARAARKPSPMRVSASWQAWSPAARPVQRWVPSFPWPATPSAL